MSFVSFEQAPERGVAGSAEESHGRPAGRAVEGAGLGAFAVDVQRRDDGTIVRARGELDVATAGTLRAALDGIEDAARLVLDLRGLSFIDSTGLHLVVALHKRAQRDGFQLSVLAPAPPVDRAFRICGLDKTLPFEAPR
jgi:anti-sigma B factor antagonist